MMIWWYFFRVYLILLRSIGLLSVGFDSKRCVFQLKSKLAIFYCILVNVLYIFLMPSAVKMKIDDLQNSKQGFLMIAINNFIAFYNIFGFLVTLSNGWMQRSLLCSLLNKYARVLRKYRAQLLSYETRVFRAETLRLFVAKSVTSLSRLVILIVFLYKQFGNHKSMNFHLSCLLIVTSETLMICADINISSFLLLTNMMFGILVQQLRNIRRDVNLMYLLESRPSAAQPGCKERHAIWRLQLCAELRKWIKYQRRLKHFLLNIVCIYQWQILVTLFCSFMNHIATLFNMLVYIANAPHFHLSFFLFVVLVFVANAWNLDLLFDTCERLTQRNREMRKQLECMLMQFVQMNGGCRPKGAELKLQRSVELFLLELLQHGIRFRICGLFDLSRRSCHQMHQGLVNYLIVLLQIAITQY